MKYTIQELADKINEELSSQTLIYQSDDKRITDSVSVRRIRSYLTQGLLDKPLKEKNRAFFTEHHFEQLKNLRLFNNMGLSDNSLKKMSTETALYQSQEPFVNKGIQSQALSITRSQNGSNETVNSLDNIKSSNHDELLQNNALSLINSFSKHNIQDERQTALTGQASSMRTSILNNLISSSPKYQAIEEQKQQALDKTEATINKTDININNTNKGEGECINTVSTQNADPISSKVRASSYYESLQSLTPTHRVWQEIDLEGTGKIFLRIEQGYKTNNKEEIIKKITDLLL